MQNKPNRVIWHHSAVMSKGHQAEMINRYHRDHRHFTESLLGYFIGYHYLIEKDGEVFQARLETEIGCHDKGENINSIGICLAGNFNDELPTEKQEIALATLLDKIIKRWKIPISRIEPHRWRDTTDCPGRRLDDYWAQKIYLKYKLSWLKKILYKLSKKLAPVKF